MVPPQIVIKYSGGSGAREPKPAGVDTRKREGNLGKYRIGVFETGFWKEIGQWLRYTNT